MLQKNKFFKIIAVTIMSIILCGTFIACGETNDIPQVATVTKIAVTKAPTKTQYVVGEIFDNAGMEVTATLSDNKTKAIKDYLYTPNGVLKTENKEILITYEGKTATQPITVADKALTAIAVTTAPTKVSYLEGESFDRSGMVVTATFNNGSKLVVSDYIVTPSNALTASVESVTITYFGKTTTQDINVTAKEVTGIEITVPPTTTIYNIGQKFKTAGMVVTASFSDGSSAAVIGYTISPDRALESTDAEITITYKGKTAKQPITIKEITSVAVTTAPTKLVYMEGETLDLAGMVITATFNDSSSIIVSDYTYTPNGKLTPEDNVITITYEGKTATQAITVQKIVRLEAETALNNSNTFVVNEDSPLATGGKYVGELRVKDKIYFKFNASSVGTTTLFLRAASSNITEKGNNWGPTVMGETQLNKVANIYVNGTLIEIPDSVVMKGGKSSTGDGDFGLYFNWTDISFENIAVNAGENEIVLEFKASGLTNFWGNELTGNIDSMSLLFNGDVTGEEIVPISYNANVVEGFTSNRTLTKIEAENATRNLNNEGKPVGNIENQDTASGGKSLGGMNGKNYMFFDFDLVEAETSGTLELIAACANWNNEAGGNSEMKDLSKFLILKVNNHTIDLSKVNLTFKPESTWTTWTSIVIDGVKLNAGKNQITLIVKGGNCPNLDVLNVYTGVAKA